MFIYGFTLLIICTYWFSFTENIFETPKTSDVEKTKKDIFCDTSNDSKILEALEENKKYEYRDPGVKCYILRLDDVQTPAWNNISMQIIDDTLKRNLSITIAVIPSRNQYDSPGIIKYIKDNRNNSRLEIAQHGYKHTYYEYKDLSKLETNESIMSGLRYLYCDYGVVPITFIPPNNQLNKENNTTSDVLYDIGFRMLSTTEGLHEEGKLTDAGQVSATAYNNKLLSQEEILEYCTENLKAQNVSVIMMHPQDFASEDRVSLDPDKYQVYLDLLDNLSKTNATSITFRDLLVEE
jgi:hypothetical protein